MVGNGEEMARSLYAQARDIPPVRSLEDNLAAEQLLLASIRSDPAYAEAYAYMAMILGSRSMFMGGQEEWADSAAIVAEYAVELAPSTWEAWWALSFARFQQSRYREAESAALRVWERLPSHRGVLNSLGFMAIYRGRHFDAVRWGLEAIEASPDWVVPRTLIGLTLMELGRIDESLAWLRSAREADPTWPPLLGFEVAALMHGGRMEEVDRLLAASDQTPPGVMATVAIAKENLTDALDYLNQQYGRAPDEMPPYGISTRARLGLVLAALNRWEDAAPLLDEAERRALHEMEEGNESKNYPLEMAAIEAWRGDLDEAARWLGEAEAKGWRDDGLWSLRPGLDPLRDDPRFQAALIRIRESHDRALQDLARAGLPGPPPPVPTRPPEGP